MKSQTFALILLGGIILFSFNNCSELSPLQQLNPTSDSLSSEDGNIDQPSIPQPMPQIPMLPADAVWPNEPSGSQRKVDCDFSTGNCAGQVSGGTFIMVVQNFIIVPFLLDLIKQQLVAPAL